MIRWNHLARRRRRFSPGPSLDRLEGRALMATAGRLDPSFGGGTGTVYLPVASQDLTLQGLGYLQEVQVESDGSIIAAGAATVNGVNTIGVRRLNADGTSDTSFGTDGVVYLVPPGETTFLDAQLLIQPGTGDIAVISSVGYVQDQLAAVVTMFNPDGTPDTAYGSDGVTILQYSGIQAAIGLDVSLSSYAAFEPDGKLTLVGSDLIQVLGTNQFTNEVAVAQLDTDGSLDLSFGGGNGVETVASVPQADFDELTRQGKPVAGEGASGVVVQPDGQPVILTSYSDSNLVGQPQRSSSLIRLNADGSTDTSLSQAGIRAIAIAASGPELSQSVGNGLILEPDGRFLALVDDEVGLINADGSLDALGAITDGQSAMDYAPLPDGGVAVLNESGTVVEINPDLTFDTAFGDGGQAQAPLTSPVPGQANYTVSQLAAQPDGSILVFGDNPSLQATPTHTEEFVPPTDDLVARLAATPTPATPGDFTGDGIADPAVYVIQTGAFAIGDSSRQYPGKVVPFGIAGPGNTIPAPGDYYGTGQDDVAAYLPTLGVYAIQDPTGQTTGIALPFGIPGYGQTIPAPDDYYGTGQADVAVYLTGPGVFAVQDPTGQTTGMAIPFGIPGIGNSIPVPGDYYGTGQADIAVYLPATATWAIQDPTGQTTGMAIPFGAPGLGVSLPVPGDYDGSGKTELAVYVPALADLIYRPAAGGPDVVIPFGAPGAGITLPAPGDYDGSGHTNVAAYLPTLGVFAYRPTKGGGDVHETVGVPNQTIPVTTVLQPQVVQARSLATSTTGAYGLLGEPDALDFVPDLARKKDAGQSS